MISGIGIGSVDVLYWDDNEVKIVCQKKLCEKGASWANQEWHVAESLLKIKKELIGN